MDDLGEIISFRVNFTKTQNILEANMRLTFFGSLIPYSLKDEQFSFEMLQKNIEKFPSGFKLSDITDIVPNSENFNANMYIKYTVYLFEIKESENLDLKKRGILIGQSKDKGSFIIGAWPYDYFRKFRGVLQRIAKDFFDGSKNFENFTHFLHITQN